MKTQKCIRACLVLLMAMPFVSTNVGCQNQPATQQASRPTLFDFSRNRPRLFGSNGVFARDNNGTQVASNTGSIFSGTGNVASGGTVQIQTQTPQEYQAYADLQRQLTEYRQRVGASDADNQQLHTELAALKQKIQLANDYNSELKRTLADGSNRFQQLQLEKNSAQQELASLQFQNTQLNQTQQMQARQEQQNQLVGFRNGNTAPTQLPGAATMRANNSLMNRLRDIQIPGGQARMDGDVIRIEFPTDRLFTPGTYQVQPNQIALLQNLVGTIKQHFPRQIIGVEAHWDGTALQPSGTTDHQLTATQALSIFNNLTQLGLPADQLFMMAMGSNRPRHPQGNQGGISPNRRTEIVIYPEAYDRSY